MNRKALMFILGISLFVMLIASTSSLIMVLAQTLPPSIPPSSTAGSNNRNASVANLNPNPENKLRTNVIPKLVEKISSLSNVIAVSTVDGIKFSGINIGDTSMTVTLKRQTNATNATVNNVSNVSSQPVTIIVSKLPINNLTDVLSMLQSTRNLQTAIRNIPPSLSPTIDLGTLLASNPGVQSNSLQVLSVLKNVQIGIGAIVRPDWSLPQTLSLGLIGLPAADTAAASASTDVILVTVVPYIGLTNLATIPLR